MVAYPNETQQQALVGRDSIDKWLLMVAVGLAYLPLHAVAVYGVLETLFRYADKHLYRHVGLAALHHTINSSQWVGSR